MTENKPNRNELLEWINVVSFAVDDVKLFLDTHPCNPDALEYFEEFKKQGKTILFVSHDLSSITKYCDRAVLLNKGIKVMEGTPKEAVDRYKMALVEQDEADLMKNASLWVSGSDSGKWRERLPLNPDTLEYGDKKAEIVDFAIVDKTGKITNIIEKGDLFSIKMNLRRLPGQPVCLALV